MNIVEQAIQRGVETGIAYFLALRTINGCSYCGEPLKIDNGVLYLTEVTGQSVFIDCAHVVSARIRHTLF